jgi:hypothetical protein
MELHDKNGRRILRPGSGKPVQPLDDVQKEIVMADMKYLIEKEKESGDWAKWQESQRPIQQLRQLDRDMLRVEYVNVNISIETVDGRQITTPIGLEDAVRNEINMRFRDPPARYERQEMPSRIMALEADSQRYPWMPPRLRTGFITEDYFIQCVGHPPAIGDLERANCSLEGQPGHMGCGWCNGCQRPRFMCGHGPSMTSTSHGGAHT